MLSFEPKHVENGREFKINFRILLLKIVQNHEIFIWLLEGSVPDNT